jgi:hypothetical protein
MSSIKKLLLISLFTPTLTFASTKGIGEYFYGPDTSENMACTFAEEKAKENALQRYVGEIVESNLREVCVGENCEFLKETYNTVVGHIKKIKEKHVEKTVEEGRKVCTVIIDADVDILKNAVKMEVKNFEPTFIQNVEMSFDIMVNKPGKFVLFNQYDDKYYKIYERKNDVVDKSFQIDNIMAVLPDGKLQSKEVLVFVYFELDKKVKDVYNEFEMKNFIGSIPVENRDVLYRYVQIVR